MPIIGSFSSGPNKGFGRRSKAGGGIISLSSSSANTFYQADSTIAAGSYTITASAGETGGLIFWNGLTQVATFQFNGTSTVSVPSAATRVAVLTNNVSSNISIAGPCSSATLSSYTPTAETLTSGTSYTKTGPAQVVVVGGGGGGAGNALNSRLNGGGGGSGGISSGYVYISSSINMSVGSAGGPGWNGTAGSGGATTFGTITANGGTGGRNRWDGPSANQPISGLGGTPGGAGFSNANNSITTPSSAVAFGLPSVGATTGPGRNYTTGAGTGSVLGGGGGSGVGTGGGTANSAPAATGYGAGGFGPNNFYNTQPYGGSGTQGVIYVRRPT